MEFGSGFCKFSLLFKVIYLLIVLYHLQDFSDFSKLYLAAFWLSTDGMKTNPIKKQSETQLHYEFPGEYGHITNATWIRS